MTDDSDPLLRLFHAELNEHSATLGHGLTALRPDPANTAVLNDLAAAARAIRGASRIMHFDGAATTATGLEDRFAAAAAGRRPITTDDLDAIEQAVRSLANLSPLNAPPTQPVERMPTPVQPPPADEPVVVAAVEPTLLEMFREEVRSHAAALSTGLVELERDPRDQRRIEPLMRAAHSLKGAARIVGLDPAVHLAHEMEDAFVAAGVGKIALGAEAIDSLLRSADLLAALADSDLTLWATSRRTELTAARTAVAAIARGQTPEPAPSPAVSPPEPPPAQAAEPQDSVVRVAAQSLNRLMGLAGESLVQARWLQPFATSLAHLKKHQDHLAARLETLSQVLASGSAGSVSSTLTEARAQAAKCRHVLAERIGEFEDHAGAAEDLNSRLYREVIVSRMRPFADLAGAFPRLVRDTTRQLGKQARLDIRGLKTEVDRDILDRLEAPLTHLLRNAVDHGIEAPDARRATGKPTESVVSIEVSHRAGMLHVAVGDDGAGIDVERIRRKVIDRGHATSDMAARMGETELLEFLFLPGFSTAVAVTEVSGRGVGLDVVQDTVRKTGGSLQVTTRMGVGTTFHLRLPLTLSVIRAVLADVAGEPYAFPHNRIEALLRVPRAEIRSVEHRQFTVVDGRNVGLVLASQLLDLRADPPAGSDLAVVLLADSSGTYGLVVDAFRGEQDLVVRPLDARLGKVPGVSAAALLDDGSPVLIADTEDLIRGMDQYIQTGTLLSCNRPQVGPASKKRVLVVDDSITVREVQRQILRNRGYEVETAVDGQDGWNKVRAGRFDLVISDVDMPRMGGLEFVRRVREDHALRDLPVVIVSYKDRDEDRLRGLDAGANAYLTKSSFHDHTFLDAVAGLIGRP